MDIISSGIIAVSAGISSTGLYVIQEGVLKILSEGWADTIELADGGNAIVSSGGTMYLCTVSSGGTATVLEEGLAQDVTVENGGLYLVSSGGTAHKSLLLSGGTQVLYQDTIAAFATIMDGGVLHASECALARNPIVSQGGMLYVWNDAIVDGAQVSGTAEIKMDGVANSATVFEGGRITVFEGGYLYEAKVSSGGKIEVLTDGVIYNPRVYDIGSITVSGGGFSYNAEVNGGTITLEGGTTPDDPGAFANNTVVKTGGALVVLSGATATAVKESGGFVEVAEGANVTFKSNTVSNLVLSTFATVHSGTNVKSATVNNGGRLEVFSGGKASDVQENGGYVEVNAGASVTFKTNTFSGQRLGAATVHSGTTAIDNTVTGRLNIYSGGIANSTLVKDRAGMHISSGGLANATDINYATVYVYNGGIADNTGIFFEASLLVLSGGSANNTTVYDQGKLVIASGATATEIKENGGFVEIEDGANVSFASNTFSGYIVSSATIHSGTTANSAIITGKRVSAFVYSGGLMENSIVGQASCYISSGGTANNTTVSRGRFQICSDGMANVTMIEGGGMIVSSGGTATNTTVNDGSMYVTDGGTANNTTVSGGDLDVYSGGTATDIAWTPCEGHVYVEEGGYATFVSEYSGVYYGSDNHMLSHEAVMNSMTLDELEEIAVMSGGTTNDTVINAYGKMSVHSGGTANDTTVLGGHLEVSSGGKLTGQTTIADGGEVIACSESILDFDISDLVPGETARINNLSLISGLEEAFFTLTISDAQTGGTYSLAEGAAGFSGTITVQNTLGESLGTITVGNTVKIDETDYTLNLNEAALTLTVKTRTPPPDNLVGTKDRVSWDPTGTGGYVVEYSMDNFEHAVQATASTNALDTQDLPAGTYQWRVKTDDSIWAVGDPIDSDNTPEPAKLLQSNGDGSGDIFFATPVGTWNDCSYALHTGSINDWKGTRELVSADGRGRIQNLFFGSSDPNMLCLTDTDNGDAVFVDDIYTGLPEGIEENMSRLYQIREIRAGAGNDIVDMTSDRFEYTGDGLTIRGGAGDDVIWANKGSNLLFGDNGNDRIVGASGNDAIAGGLGNDRMHGGGGDDVFTFCDNWGEDTVQQLAGSSVTLWFLSGSISNWDAESLTYTDGTNSVRVSGVTANDVTLIFGDDGDERFASLSEAGAFLGFTSDRVFEESGKGILASL